ncbi:methyltransferase domain-containing protein [Candidatus Kaiserbacteria bacterium]|nr:methyltransferase domain-containing protein [Candidatus Kaiserbacteria bacterium]
MTQRKGMPPLVAHLKQTGVLRSAPVLAAFEEIDRADFVPENLKPLAYEDTALPIGGGQTISQPYTVAFMLEQLQVRGGDTVLEVGYGSGWQTALLSHLVGPSGRVYAFEVLPTLCRLGENNLEKYPHLARRVQFLCRSGEKGYPEKAPFDRIIAAAEVAEAPPAWREQLRPSGRMMYPKNSALILEEKRRDGSIKAAAFPGFAFVPFVKNAGDK